jgi:hypothetical protein
MVDYQPIAELVKQIPADTWKILQEIQKRRPATMLNELLDKRNVRPNSRLTESKWWYRLLAMFGDRRCRSGILIQLFDGLGAAIFGVLTPLVVSGIAHDTGHYTTLLGVIGLAIGSGAALNTTAAGLIADNFGGTTAFLGLTGAVLCATLFVRNVMPETRPAATERTSDLNS